MGVAAKAQQPAAAAPVAAMAEPDTTASHDGEWRVSLLTCSPGHEIYELEGHSGLRLVNQQRGVDVVVN